MKHQSNRDFFAYWDSRRAGARAPSRNQIDPSAIRHMVAHTFVASAAPHSGFPFTMVGTWICKLLDRNLPGESLPGLFSGANRADIGEILAAVVNETLPAVVGVSATAVEGTPVTLELLLLPFAARPHFPAALTGSLVALAEVPGYAIEPWLRLSSWRFLATPPAAARPVRKLTMGDGVMVYEAAS
ncbi:hypothetical protein ACVIGB_000700 [Bradyrhizobium sp. USDA 4341]